MWVGNLTIESTREEAWESNTSDRVVTGELQSFDRPPTSPNWIIKVLLFYCPREGFEFVVISKSSKRHQRTDDVMWVIRPDANRVTIGRNQKFNCHLQNRVSSYTWLFIYGHALPRVEIASFLFNFWKKRHPLQKYEILPHAIHCVLARRFESRNRVMRWRKGCRGPAGVSTTYPQATKAQSHCWQWLHG